MNPNDRPLYDPPDAKLHCRQQLIGGHYFIILPLIVTALNPKKKKKEKKHMLPMDSRKKRTKIS
jgi:hypothetical protein